MKISDIMTREVEYIRADTPLKQAAETMERLDTGFLPIGNSPQDKLLGVVTDRDITIRGVAKGLDPADTPVQRVITDKVLYCYDGRAGGIPTRGARQQQRQAPQRYCLSGRHQPRWRRQLSRQNRR